MRPVCALLAAALAFFASHVAVAARRSEVVSATRGRLGAGVPQQASAHPGRLPQQTRSWRRLPTRLALRDRLRVLVLDFLPTRYALVLTEKYTGEIQVWGIDPSFSRMHFWDNFTTGTVVIEGDPMPTFLPGHRLLFIGGSRDSRRPVVWDIASRQPLHELRGYTTICGISSGGEWVVASNEEIGSIMWSPISGVWRWRSGIWCDAAAFSPDGGMVALVDKSNAIVLDTDSGRELCKSTWWPGSPLRPVDIVFTESSLDVCRLLRYPTEFEWLVSYSFLRLDDGCQLISGREKRVCHDIVVSDGDAFLLQVGAEEASVKRMQAMEEAGGGKVATAATDAGSGEEFQGGRFSPRGRSALLRSWGATRLWNFAGGQASKLLLGREFAFDWTYSDDGEVLLAFPDPEGESALTFADAASGMEIAVSVDSASTSKLRSVVQNPGKWAMRLSGPRYWGAGAHE